MNIVDSKIHGFIDYAFVGLLLLSPIIFGLDQKATLISSILGGIHLTLAIFTNFELGLFLLIPFDIHGKIELLVPFIIIGVAIYLGYVENNFSRNYFLGIATAVFITWVTTDYKSFIDYKNF